MYNSQLELSARVLCDSLSNDLKLKTMRIM